MKLLKLIPLLFLGACSSEPTDEDIKEYISTVDCAVLSIDGEHQKLVEKVKQFCASQNIRKFKAQKSSEKSW